jgi:hypothetical protein
MPVAESSQSLSSWKQRRRQLIELRKQLEDSPASLSEQNSEDYYDKNTTASSTTVSTALNTNNDHDDNKLNSRDLEILANASKDPSSLWKSQKRKSEMTSRVDQQDSYVPHVSAAKRLKMEREALLRTVMGKVSNGECNIHHHEEEEEKDKEQTQERTTNKSSDNGSDVDNESTATATATTTARSI